MWVTGGGEFLTIMKDREQHRRRHVVGVLEVQLIPGDLWKGDSWCRACGLKAIWSPAYREEGGGVRAGVAVTADASVGLEVHKATGGQYWKLDT